MNPVLRVSELLERCGTPSSVLPPTELYCEGWLLRLVLDWFDRSRARPHRLAFLSGASWYSEALLPSRFLPRYRGDRQAESFTRADGIFGHFSISPGERGEAVLLPTATQFVVTEAKMGSPLSAGTKNAPDFDQAARNVACMAYMIGVAGISPRQFGKVAFYVLAPERQITSGAFGDMVSKESVHRKVSARVQSYDGLFDTWFRDCFEPVLDLLDVDTLSWESILSELPISEESSGLHEFYSRCLRFIPSQAT